jgi:lipid A ethanolaminephosphotransferase
VYAQYSRYASAARNRDISFGTVAPLNVVAGLVHYAATEFAARTIRAPRGVDARSGYAIPKSRLLVLLVGETARAGNHGLNGYARDTTPRMREAQGYYFADTESCGTVTTISIPCIFSGLSREEFTLLRGRQNETLIDVVKRSGARVIWVDNDSGCKDVCSAAEYLDVTGWDDKRYCREPGDCYDEILLDGLEDRIRQGSGDTLVVLHLKGSHGPAYYRRYPPQFEWYTPVCTTSDLSSCDRASIVNAYDNTIVYTDHVVGEVIDLLRRQAGRFATALLYVSDHGESLGEAGLYLHGMPWSMAPREQKTVPMYAWVSPEFLMLERWDTSCMAKQTQTRRSHDNVYATVLGFMEVESVEYKPELDLFEPCDPPRAR